MSLNNNPFGVSITVADIVDSLGFFDGWEERYKYIIDLGKELPAMAADLKHDDNLVRGCQSQVWINSALKDGKLFFEVDSDAFIVKGLLALVMAAYNAKTPADIIAFDIEAYFDELTLIKHLSATRGNGVKSMVQRIRETAATA